LGVTHNFAIKIGVAFITLYFILLKSSNNFFFLRFNLLKQGFILLSLYSNGIEFIQNIISIYNFHITHHSINTLLFQNIHIHLFKPIHIE